MVQYNHKQLLTYTSLMLLLVVFILVNVVNNIFLKPVRFDFSEQKIYTLSAGSKEILAEINEPINIRLYFSKSLIKSSPYLASYADKVQELLAQYQRASNNTLKVTVIDPEAFPEAEDQAVNYGLQSIHLDGYNSEFYFGLVATNTITNKEVIPLLQPAREAYLEHDVSQIIYNLIYPAPIGGIDALISIRNRESSTRSFSTLQVLQAKAEEKLKAKESILMQSLEKTKQKLLALEQKKNASSSIISSVKQKHTEEKFRNELVGTKRQLRKIDYELNKDVERIEHIIMFINIVLMPLLVLLSGGVFWLYRTRTNRFRYNYLLYKTTN